MATLNKCKLNLFCLIAVLLYVILCTNGQEPTLESEQNVPTQVATTSSNLPIQNNAFKKDYLADRVLDFGIETLRQTTDGSNNCLISPIQLHGILSMALLATEPDSQAEADLLRVLGSSPASDDRKSPVLSATDLHQRYRSMFEHFSDITTKAQREAAKPSAESAEEAGQESNKLKKRERYPLILDLENVVLVDEDIKLRREFTDKIKTYHNTTISDLPGGSPEAKSKFAAEFNKLAKEGAGFDGDLMTSEDMIFDDKQVSLMSTVFVQAQWLFYNHMSRVESPFTNEGLKKKMVPFVLGESSKVKTMRFSTSNPSDPSYFGDQVECVGGKNGGKLGEHDDFRMIQIPLVSDLTLTIWEPETNAPDGVVTLTEQLLAPGLNGSRALLVKSVELLDSTDLLDLTYVSFPAFRFESELNLREMASLNSSSIFHKPPVMTQILKNWKPMQLASTKANAILDLNHKGVKGAAIRNLLTPKVMPRLTIPCHIHVKRPFIYLIRQARVPLFMGHVVSL